MIAIELDRQPAVYLPGEPLQFHWEIQRAAPDQLDRIELSVLWFTEGKGEEDLAVHEFWEVPNQQLATAMIVREPIQTKLPLSPLSYEGHLLRIRWCVRLRLFLSGGMEVVSQQPFYLGPLTREV